MHSFLLMHTFGKEKTTDCKMYGYLPWYYYFVTIIINIIIDLNILDIDVFSPAGNQHQVNIYFIIIIIIIIITLKYKKSNFILCRSIAYTNEFGKVRNLNDNVREFP